MTRIIAVSNQKGGVGKTTTAVNLAASIARRGRSTLLVDVDPQGNATSFLGLSKDTVEFGMAEVMLGLEPMRRAVVATKEPNLDLSPATPTLQGAEVELVGLANRERRIELALSDLPKAYDFVIIDTPPSLGLLTLNALVAADSVLVPLQAEYFAMEGLGELVRTIAAVRRGPNPRLVREGVVLTMFDARTNLCREVERQAREVLGEEVFKATIPRAVRLSEAPSHGKSIFGYAGGSSAAQAYHELADEVIARAAAAARAGGARASGWRPPKRPVGRRWGGASGPCCLATRVRRPPGRRRRTSCSASRWSGCGRTPSSRGSTSIRRCSRASPSPSRSTGSSRRSSPVGTAPAGS